MRMFVQEHVTNVTVSGTAPPSTRQMSSQSSSTERLSLSIFSSDVFRQTHCLLQYQPQRSTSLETSGRIKKTKERADSPTSSSDHTFKRDSRVRASSAGASPDSQMFQTSQGLRTMTSAFLHASDWPDPKFRKGHCSGMALVCN